MSIFDSASNPRAARKGFTLIEIVVASAILGLLAVLAVPALQGFVGNSATTAKQSQARFLVTAVTLYRTKTGNAITGSAVDPMTTARANQIYAQIAGPVNAAGEVIVESGFALNANATFPTAWGESSPGVFDPIP